MTESNWISAPYKFPKCPRCGIMFMDDSALQRHVLMCNVKTSGEHNGTSKRVSTNNIKCGRRTSSGHLRQPSVDSYSCVDVSVCKRDDEGPHVCVLCGEEFKTWEEVNKHLESHNVLEAHHKCPKCGENFHNKHDFDVHVKMHQIRGSSVILGNQNSNVEQIANVSKPPARSVVLIKKAQVTNTKKHKCSMCNEQFQEFSDPNKHLTSHVPKVVTTSHKCDISSATFLHSSTLKDQHMGIQYGHKGQKFPCVICGKVFCSIDERKQHLVAHIESGEQLQTLLKYTCENSPTCPFCNKRFAERTFLEAHMLNYVHIRKKLYGCTICGNNFISASALKGHHCTDEGKRGVSMCYVCEKAVKEGVFLTEHDLSHADRSNCSICKNKYKIVSSPMKVYRKIQAKPVSHSMPTNITKAIPVSKPTNIPKILPANKPVQVKRTECPICAKLFTSAAQIVHHTKAYHLRDGLPFCQHCKKYFKNTAALKAHQVTVYQQQKKKILHSHGSVSRCSICNQAYNNVTKFKSHCRIHISAGLPFCHLCREYYACTSNLRQHYQAMHKARNIDATQYRCAHCRENFTELSVLRSHMLAHNTQDCTSCDTCVRGFSGVYHLEKHLVIHHSESHSDNTSTVYNEPMVQSGQL